jgi:hypothetical protein
MVGGRFVTIPSPSVPPEKSIHKRGHGISADARGVSKYNRYPPYNAHRSTSAAPVIFRACSSALSLVRSSLIGNTNSPLMPSKSPFTCSRRQPPAGG